MKNTRGTRPLRKWPGPVRRGGPLLARDLKEARAEKSHQARIASRGKRKPVPGSFPAPEALEAPVQSRYLPG